jgi:hypothetical protein
MSGQRASCCDTSDEVIPDATRPTSREAVSNDRPAGLVAAPADRGRPGLTRIIRRLFGAGARTEKT